MKTAVLACNTIRAEVELAVERVGCHHDLYWLESNLHNVPVKLGKHIQESIEVLFSYERVLLAFGFCGNAVAGLKSGPFELILPRVDDCISLLLGSVHRRVQMSKEYQSIYLTEGWLKHESNIENEYKYLLNKYGDKTARQIIDSMYAHYTHLSIIDTDVFDIDKTLERTKKIANIFSLEQTVVSGTTEYIENLLVGPWPDDTFIRLHPQSVLDADKLVLS